MNNIKKNLSKISMVILLIAIVLSEFSSVFAPTINTNAFINVKPNPVGVNQTVLVCFRIQPSPTEAGIENGIWEGITIEVTEPDGDVTTFGPFQTDTAGVASTYYTPSMVGTHTFQMFFPGDMSGTDDYTPSESNRENLIVQEEPVDFDLEELSCETVSDEICSPEQLTFNTAHDAGPSISGDGSKIVFHSSVDGDPEIFIMKYDGTDLTQLTSNAATDWGPCISYNGGKVAFHSDVDGDNEIYLVNSDGSGLTQLTHNTANDFYPSISADGTKIAFSSDVDGDREIFIVNSDGSGLTQLTHNTANDLTPHISGDGTKIAFTSNVDGDYEIFIVNSDGSGLTQLTHNAAHDYGAYISGDGTKIAFESDIDGNIDDNDLDIFVINSDGTGLTQLTRNSAWNQSPSINEDGSIITFQSDMDGDWEIFSVTSASTRLTQLTHNTAADHHPSISGRGFKIAFVSDVDGDDEIFLCMPRIQPLFLSLGVEDALEGVIVNKVAGDTTEAASRTFVEIATKLLSFSSDAAENIPVMLTIYRDLFGSPVNTWVRTTSGGDRVGVTFDSLGSGQYQVTTDLSPIHTFLGTFYYKQVVWRFQIPNDVSPQDVTVKARIQIPCEDPSGTSKIRILAPGSVRSIIVTNRELLYDNYEEWQVNNLLQRLFTEAQGHPASHTPRAIIYYVERYSASASNWDNTNVNFASENTANVVANDIDDLIEDWHDDATLYINIWPFRFPIASPNFLLIVGDDDTIPFYRYNDPSDHEGIAFMGGCPHGWCVDSNAPPNVNPAVWATDNDYFFTDNPYADLGGGTDWQTGDIELAVGRLLGETAADMLSLLREGVSWDNGDTGGVVMASVDGWELGLEPDDGRAGEIADLNDVTALLRDKGFQVRNDDIPSSEVQTIDVIDPYEGGVLDWNSNFTDAANNAGGMDIFFIGGHDSYDYAMIPGDDFSPDDTPTKYTRFGVDNPIAMIVGCHGGLPVLDGGGLNGGADNCMVHDLIQEGASAYIGATGFSYGSPNGRPANRLLALHRCTWGERLIQEFFNRLMLPSGGNSMALGSAMAQAKSNYVFGFGVSDDLDRKTVTEYNVYGVPWTFVYYPNAQWVADSLIVPLEQDFTILPEPVIRIGENLYSRTFDVNIESYNVDTEIQNDTVYHLFSIKGGDVAISDGAPILPYIEGWKMATPFDSVVTNVEIVAANSLSIGSYNVPIAQIGPFSGSGIEYTTKTDINYPFPTNDDLVQYQQTSDGLLFTLFPIQHNPTTDETVFYSNFKIQVTYESPLPVVITEFTTDKAQYLSGEEINTSTVIENVGNEDIILRATLTITDAFGETVGQLMSDDFIVPSGGSHLLPLVWKGILSDGAYTAQIIIESQETVLGGSSTGIAVLTYQISGITVPDQLNLNEEGIFQVSFANYGNITVAGELKLSIMDGEGHLVEELTPQSINCPSCSTAAAEFSWTPINVNNGTYNAIATAIVEGKTYGPTTQSFQIFSPDQPPPLPIEIIIILIVIFAVVACTIALWALRKRK